jgi:hypothetical protein
MSTDLPSLPSDAQLLYEYLGRQIDAGSEEESGQAVVADLAAYQQQLDRLRELIRAGEQSLDAGRARELDLDALLARVQQRIASQAGAP